MTNELNDVRCPCGAEFKADSYDAGFIAGSGMCQNCDAAMPPKDIPAPVEQAGGDERAVDGKPRATKCPDCGEGDLMPGDLCACGYETDPAAGYACSECDGSGDGYVGEVCRECDGSGWFVTPEQARAALAQPSGEVVVTKNESGAIVSVTRQDKEGRVLSVIAESATLTAQAEQAEAEGSEIVATLFTPNEKVHNVIGFKAFAVAGDCDKDGGEFYDPEKLMTVAQHERIVRALRAVITQLRQHKNDYMDAGQETYRALQNEIREREAEIARLDGLVSGRTAERDAALAEVERIKTISDNYYVLCVERQQQLDAALARVEQQERTIAGMNEAHAKLAGLYEAAQAQHSVPEGFRELLEMLVASDLRKIRYAGAWRREVHDRASSILALLAAAPGMEVPQAWLDVQAERRRQVEAEGWTPEHDDEHACDEIAAFACFYAMPPAARDWDTSSTGYGDTLGEAILPEGWEPKTGDRRREMVKACALTLAEI
ncbi:TPA: hypothetical protein NIE10_006461, partial [Pseudomonas aeruginosa]|nr:hypothetical protein [Pseudomonas aeruginosa]